MKRGCVSCRKKATIDMMQQTPDKHGQLHWICDRCLANRKRRRENKEKLLTGKSRLIGQDQIGRYRILKRVPCVYEID